MRISVSALTKVYGRDGHRALAGISLTAEDGEFLVLLGPSGSGKTTLLRALAGLEEVDSGEIAFDGRRMNEMGPGERNIGMVFQDYALYPHLSVRDNIAYNMKIRRIARPEIERRVREVATMLGLEQLLDRKPSQLSGGQRQRVAVGRAITRSASVLLMDEPLSNLDAQIREHVRVELRELQRRLRITTVYVTHDQVEAMVMADRIAVMANGTMEQVGTPGEIYGRPATLFCARFVGSPKINELHGRVARDDGGLLFTLADAPGPAFRLAPLDPADTPPPGEVLMAFRAEDTEIASGISALGLPADIVMIENRGAEQFAVTVLPASLKAGQASADLRLRCQGPAPADRGMLRFWPTRAHLFDPATARRLATVACAPCPADGGPRASLSAADFSK